MTFLPIAAGLLAALFWGTSDYLATRPSRKLGQYRTTAYLTLFSAITMLPALLYVGISTTLSSTILLAAIIIAIINFIGLFFSYRAFRYGSLSITAPIVGAYPAVAVVGAVLILHDTLSNVQTIAIAGIILGVILLSMKLNELKSKTKFVAAGVGSAIISAIFLGVPSIFAGAYIAIIGYALLGATWRFIPAILGFSTGLLTKQDMRLPSKGNFLLPLVAAGVLDGFAVLVYVYGIFAETSGLPILAAAAAFAGAVSVICALVILKERPEKNQLIGIALAVIGIVALSYFS